jgi:hypothetical protein
MAAAPERALSAAAAAEGAEHRRPCLLLTGRFALAVQAWLFSTAVFTLISKRFHESPKRSWTLWFMDTSKQGAALLMQHFLNVFLAMFWADGDEFRADECIWYIVNFVISVSLGLAMLTAYVRVHRGMVDRYELTWLRFGEYGTPPRWEVWFVQCVWWCVVSLGQQLALFCLFILPFRLRIDRLIAPLEAPMKAHPRIELALVMVVVPAIFNGMFAWVVDNLIQSKAAEDDGSHEFELLG